MKMPLLLLAASLLSLPGLAAEVRFTADELNAAGVLLKPESMLLTLHGTRGKLEPPAFVRYFGLQTLEFPINMSEIADIIDLRFDHAIGRNPSLDFVDGGLEVGMSFDSRLGVVRSRVGRVDCRNVKITAVLSWRTRPSGTRELYVSKMRFAGSLSGKGILGTRIVLNRVKKLAMKLFGEQIQNILSRPEVQIGIQNGLSQWTKIAIGSREVEADPTTFRFVNEGGRTSLRFESTP